MKRIGFFVLCIILQYGSAWGQDYTKYVDPMIGTGAHYSNDAADLWGTVRKQKPLKTSKLGTMAGYDKAHDPGQCIPAVLTPHGMNFWVAQTEDTEQKEISPYYYKDEEIQGFRNSHWIVGGMTQDYGSFTLMPIGTELVTNAIERGSKFEHGREISTPYYYSVELDRYGVKAEMTATCRSAIFRFTYQEAGDVYLVVNANSDERLGRIAYNAETKEITGSNPVHRIYQGWGEYAGFDGHLVVRVNKDILDGGVKDSCAWVKYHVEAGETVMVKAASSFTDVAHAQQNMQQEIPSWNFDDVCSQLKATWQDTLGRIEAESKDETLLKNFYTSLYHASFLPRTYNDCDGSYPTFANGKSSKISSGTYYDDFSLWDTYRAEHPLICLLNPQMAGDMIQSLLIKYDEGGWLPIFPCWNSYTSEMIGDPVCSLVADAYFKGVSNFDMEKAYRALMKNAYEQPLFVEDYRQGKGRRALESYLKYGYIPVEDEVLDAYHKREQTSRTLEYAYADFCLANYAFALGHKEEAMKLNNRTYSYRNVYNPELGWVDGRHADGSWVNGDAYSFQKYITEGKPCHYTWYVPHNIEDLAELMGGNEVFIKKLDAVFDNGAYWHGNEPCHQMAYLYDYVGAPWKTQQRVRHIMKTEYDAAPDGLAGNDDAGQMSAWYIFSAMGFYPVCPGVTDYAIGSPCFDRLTIHNADGTEFVIEAENASDKNIYVQSATINEKPITTSFLNHSDIMNGGKLKVVMGSMPVEK